MMQHQNRDSISRGSAKRKRIFQEGASALQRLGVAQGPLYCCPMCYTVYTEEHVEGSLTLEHAPPQSLGGHEVALTCEACNNDWGTLQGHLGVYIRGVGIPLTPKLAGSPRVVNQRIWVAKDGSERVNARLIAEGSKLTIKVAGQRNNPVIFDNVAKALWESGSGQLIVPKGHTANSQEVMLPLIHAAYILAFASLGHDYIFRPSVQRVREALEARHWHGRSPLWKGNDESPRWGTFLIDGPVQGIALGFGTIGVLLPLKNEAEYKELLNALHSGTRLKTRGRLSWPRGIDAVWDDEESWLHGRLRLSPRADQE